MTFLQRMRVSSACWVLALELPEASAEIDSLQDARERKMRVVDEGVGIVTIDAALSSMKVFNTNSRRSLNAVMLQIQNPILLALSCRRSLDL